MRAILHSQRGGPSRPLSLERFEVPFTPGQTVLDGLRYIRARIDETLSFRFSCINANACKHCMMLIDGKAAYACIS